MYSLWFNQGPSLIKVAKWSHKSATMLKIFVWITWSSREIHEFFQSKQFFLYSFYVKVMAGNTADDKREIRWIHLWALWICSINIYFIVVITIDAGTSWQVSWIFWNLKICYCFYCIELKLFTKNIMTIDQLLKYVLWGYLEMVWLILFKGVFWGNIKLRYRTTQ